MKTQVMLKRVKSKSEKERQDEEYCNGEKINRCEMRDRVERAQDEYLQLK